MERYLFHGKLMYVASFFLENKSCHILYYSDSKLATSVKLLPNIYRHTKRIILKINVYTYGGGIRQQERVADSSR